MKGIRFQTFMDSTGFPESAERIRKIPCRMLAECRGKQMKTQFPDDPIPRSKDFVEYYRTMVPHNALIENSYFGWM